MLSIALRFVPTLMDEMETILNAQRSRGVDFGSGSLKHRIQAAVPLLVPLFTGAINHAENLSTAMEARGFTDSEHRSKYRVYKWKGKDTISWIVFLLVGVVVLFVRKIEVITIRYKVTLAYDGTLFSGFERQPNRRTIEGVLTQKVNIMAKILSHQLLFTGQAGPTPVFTPLGKSFTLIFPLICHRKQFIVA